jgi:ribulose-bisphosphate carboxylase large chain
MIPASPIVLSGERFQVIYRIAAPEAEALAIVRDICVEQTVEFPLELIPEGDIRDRLVGRVETFEQMADDSWQAAISYAVESSGGELTQLLNVVFGNYSMKPRVRVERLALPSPLLAALGGPRFGREGLRRLLGIPRRPILCTALKPMGLSLTALADLTYRLAIGGIDIVKDDHGLANQPFAPFEERVWQCAEAVASANRETGSRSIYVPNVTAGGEVPLTNARFARAAGAGGLLVSPGLAGLGTMARLAKAEDVALPIFSHPAFQGSYVTKPDAGIAHGALFGQITRLAGADASIYPNFGGRFSFSPDACREIADACAEPFGDVPAIFPMPGGGMSVQRVPELLDFYGDDVILLIGGGLFQHGPDLLENCREFRKRVETGRNPGVRIQHPE